MHTVKLGGLIKVTSGFAFKSAMFNSNNNGLPLIRIRDVVRGFSDTYYSGEYKNEYIITNGDALIGMDGEFNLALWKGNKALLNQRVCKIESIDERLNQEYLIRFLPQALKDIEDKTPFVTVKHLSVKDINNIEIPLPPLEEQRRIAAILDQADALCQKRQQSLEKLDQLLQATFIEMFGDPVSNPKGWELNKFDDVIDFITGYAFKSNDFQESGIKLCRGTNVLPNKLDWSDTACWKEEDWNTMNKYQIKKNDILIAMDRPWISSGFKMVLIEDDKPNLLLVQRVARLRSKGSMGSNFIYHIFKSPKFKKHCRITETTVPHISPNDFRSFEIISPPKEMIDKFERVAEKVNFQRKQLLHADLNFKSLFNSLQQKAFTGRL